MCLHDDQSRGGDMMQPFGSACLVAAAVTMARMTIKLAHDLQDATLRVSKEHEDKLFEEFATPAVVARAHVDVDVISSCAQTAVAARAHRRGAPRRNWESETNLHEMHQDTTNRAVDGRQAVARDAESSAPEKGSRSSRSRPRSLRPHRRTGAQTARRDETQSRDGAHEASRERTARSAWCGKHRRKAPPDTLTVSESRSAH